MKNIRIKYLISLFIRAIIGIAFIYAGINKFFDLTSFAKTIETFGVLPDVFSFPLAIMLPIIEIICGAGLILNNTEALNTISVLLIIFTSVLIYGIISGIDVDCGCYGANDPVASSLSSIKTSLVRDLVMISGIIFVYYYRYTLSLKKD